jgi:hypothetical protein
MTIVITPESYPKRKLPVPAKIARAMLKMRPMLAAFVYRHNEDWMRYGILIKHLKSTCYCSRYILAQAMMYSRHRRMLVMLHLQGSLA